MALHWITFRFYGTWRWRNNGNAYANKCSGAAYYCDRQTGALIETRIDEICAEQGWTLFDRVVMRTHIHVLFRANNTRDRTAVLRMIKSRITKMLRKRGIIGSNTRLWSKGNDRYELLSMSHLPRLLAYCAKNRTERDSKK